MTTPTHQKTVSKGNQLCYEFFEFNAATAQRLKVHFENVHLGIRHFCQLCDKNFGEARKLYSYIKEKHPETEKYQCEQCEFSTYDLKRLQSHEARQHERSACELCSKNFGNQQALNRHIQSVHEGKRLTCDQ